MKIAICGMSGFVGSALRGYFEKQGDTVIGISVRKSSDAASIVQKVNGCDVLINLAGASILGRWSKSYKELLRTSRLDTTDKLVAAIALCTQPPHTLLNASAVGIYDSFHQHDESSRHLGDDFLAGLVHDWEYSAMRAQSDRTRVCTMRFGVVYGSAGGAMTKMLPPFKMGLGGKMGDGFQMVSWIHLEDLVRACAFLIEHTQIKGIVNLTSPEPISNMAQTKAMGRILHRPTFFDLPAWLVKLAFGEGSRVMLDSKEVYPKVLQENGFTFLYPTFDSAMVQIAHARD
ncbi:TIGR01777 family oxidoreductase [uncultured Sulfuricurvum sp.]|uniref:TIGR01777 family oxidoreductase n=1 Tax=uncultured Sulfuricurvum sp. TaxID=430693 RepID=UPI002608DC89|nr:TIGR01777 family oxidoreductase [uncultured Sulfuricurvum sp.]